MVPQTQGINYAGVKDEEADMFSRITRIVSAANVPLQAFSAGEMNVVMRDLPEPMCSKLDIRWSVLM